MKRKMALLIVLIWIAGFIFNADLAGAPSARRKAAEKTSGEKGRRRRPTPEENLARIRKGLERRFNYKIVLFNVGDEAPDFELPRLKSIPKSGKVDLGKLKPEDKVKLSFFKGKKPVVLIFSSYT